MTLVFFSCEKEVIDKDSVIKDLVIAPKSSIYADGESRLEISVKLNVNADIDKRGVVFTTNDGEFVNGKDGTITKKADFENGELVAKVQLVVSNSLGIVKITAKPEVSSQFVDFVLKDSVTKVTSIPQKISLHTSSLSVKSGFASEVEIVGTIKNEFNKNASSGVKVEFEDVFQDLMPVEGRFRVKNSTTGSGSQVSCIYSPGYVKPHTDIYIKCYILDSLGKRTLKRDSIKINVIKDE